MDVSKVDSTAASKAGSRVGKMVAETAGQMVDPKDLCVGFKK